MTRLVDNNDWFQSWNPSPNLIPVDHQRQVFRAPYQMANFNIMDDHYHNTVEKYNNLPNFLPLFMQLSLINPNPPPSKSENLGGPFLEKTGPFKTWYRWKYLDFAYDSIDDRTNAIYNGDYIRENNLPLGLEVYKNRLFVTMPKWKPGVPATLAVLPRIPEESSPLLAPYPNWHYHRTESCDGLTSVFRIQADTCGRLWVLDSGQIDVTLKPRQICPPQIMIFDLNTDLLLFRHRLPKEFIKQDGLFSNIAVDVRDGDCENVHAYLTDVWRYALVVYSLKKNRSWRITHHLFYPEPFAASYVVHGLEFKWTDGLFGLALSPYDKRIDDRLLYFHPMSSFREFYVRTSIICNETGWHEFKNAFNVMGQSRGKFGHVSASGMDRNGIMFFNLVTRDSVGCWDSKKPYKRDNIGIVAKNDETMIFPNDLKIDNEKRQSVWVLTNRLPIYLYRELNKNEINFRVMSAYTDEAIRSNICDPQIGFFDTFDNFQGEEDCF